MVTGRREVPARWIGSLLSDGSSICKAAATLLQNEATGRSAGAAACGIVSRPFAKVGGVGAMKTHPGRYLCGRYDETCWLARVRYDLQQDLTLCSCFRSRVHNATHTRGRKTFSAILHFSFCTFRISSFEFLLQIIQTSDLGFVLNFSFCVHLQH